MSERRQEVWGDPIAHSQSPQLHLAAYRALGLNWEYRRVQVAEADIRDSFRTLAPEVGGLSLTMPLKEAILPLVSDHRGPVDLLHAANTVVREGDRWWLDNTDWFGVDQALREHGGVERQDVWLLGAGATARSVIYALSRSNPSRLTIIVRDRSRARVGVVLAETLGLSVRVAHFDEVDEMEAPQWVISTIPHGSVENPEAFAQVAAKSQYLDAAYDPWPTPLARVWSEHNRTVISGLTMLSYQALGQVRAFVNGDSSIPLEGEQQVLNSMREAVGLAAGSSPNADVGE